jgi:hypothetical protein
MKKTKAELLKIILEVEKKAVSKGVKNTKDYFSIYTREQYGKNLLSQVVSEFENWTTARKTLGLGLNVPQYT